MLHLTPPFRIAILITTAIAAALQSTAPARAGEPSNLLRNPGAEQGKEGDPSFWFRAWVPAEGLRMWRARDQAHSGEACFAIANTHQYEQTVCNNWAQELEEIPHGQTIRLSAYVKTADADNVNLCIQCWDRTKKEMLAFGSTPVLHGDQAWTSIASTLVVVPPQTAAIVVRAVLTGKGQVWFDDLNLAVVEPGESGAVEASSRGAQGGPEQGHEPGGESANLLRNPGAEQGQDIEPSSWFRACVPAEGLRMWRALDQAHSGKASLAIANTQQYEQTVCNNWAQELQDVPVGRTIRLSAYVKTADADNVNLCIQCWDRAKKAMVAFSSTLVLQGDQDWTLIATTPVTVPPETASIVVRAILTGKGQVWFDDLDLAVVEEGQSGAMRASPRLAAAGPEQAGPSPNLLRNPGAEEGHEGEPAYWFRASVPALGLRMWRALDQAHSGEASLAIANTHQYDQPVWNNWAQQLPEAPVGRTLRLSAYVKTADADKVLLALICWGDMKEPPLGFAATPELHGDQAWALVTTTPLLVPPGTTVVMVRAVLEGKGQVWFDDLNLAVVEEVGPGALDERLYGVWTGYEQGREQVKWVALCCTDKVVLVGTSGEGGCGPARTDTTCTPHHIDATATCSCSVVEATGAKVLGIYQIAGNTLTLCLSRPGAPNRPADFGVPGARVLILTRQE
jgi:uncharacterized protein (TIGR03067 family)